MARATKKTGGKRSAQRQASREHPLARPLLHLSTVFGKMVDRLGIPAAVLILLLGTVYLLGNKKTQDDFLRELLFGELNQRPVLTVFIVLLVMMMLTGGGLRRRGKKMESEEIKRIAAEKSRLQAQLIGKDLSHTESKLLQLPPGAHQDTQSLLVNSQPDPAMAVKTNHKK